jgi:hypothetical protein
MVRAARFGEAKQRRAVAVVMLAPLVFGLLVAVVAVVASAIT